MRTGVVESVSMNADPVFQIGSNSSNFDWKGKVPKSEILIGMDWGYAGLCKYDGNETFGRQEFSCGWCCRF
jgi:hypothetical protein